MATREYRWPEISASYQRPLAERLAGFFTFRRNAIEAGTVVVHSQLRILCPGSCDQKPVIAVTVAGLKFTVAVGYGVLAEGGPDKRTEEIEGFSPWDLDHRQ